MRYRGFEIVNEPYENEEGTGFYCVIFSTDDKEHKDSIEEFNLEIGDDIRDCSESELKRAIIRFIDENYEDLISEFVGISNKQTYEQFCNAVGWISESICDKEALYYTLSKVIGMDDKSIVQMGYKNLVQYFDKDAYAETIADYLMDTGMTRIEFQDLTRKFGIDLAKDTEMLKKIENTLNKYPEIIAEWDITEQGFDLRFYGLNCPSMDDDLCDEDLEQIPKL